MRRHGFVILDWNGLLQDDLLHIYECGVQRIFRHFGVPCPTLEEYRNQVTADFMNSFYWPRGIPKDATKEQLKAIMQEGFDEKGTPPPLFPDAERFVRTLHDRGYPLAVVSGYGQTMLDDAVARNGLGPCFLEVRGDVKDKASVFRELMARHGRPGTETAAFGDQAEDLVAAVDAGAVPFMVTRGFHSMERLMAAADSVSDRMPMVVYGGTLDSVLNGFP